MGLFSHDIGTHLLVVFPHKLTNAYGRLRRGERRRRMTVQESPLARWEHSVETVGGLSEGERAKIGHRRFERLNNNDDEMHRVSATHLENINEYYDDVLLQAKASFMAAIVLAGLGFGVLLFTVLFTLLNNIQGDQYWIGVVSGGLVQFLSAIAFFVYKRSTEQFNNFHICLERTNRYLMAYNLDGLIKDNSVKDRAMYELALLIAQAPMLTQGHLEAARTTRHAVPKEVEKKKESG
jgi:ABC-type Fe3+-siderophore transport system permease subunit